MIVDNNISRNIIIAKNSYLSIRFDNSTYEPSINISNATYSSGWYSIMNNEKKTGIVIYRITGPCTISF